MGTSDCVFDAVIILGGGVLDDGSLPIWVLRRIKKALDFKDKTKYFITSSAYTINKKPIINKMGFPVNESVKMGELLVKAGIDKSRILTERWSHDTIGNAYFTRLIHVDQLNLKKLLIITSEFHMPRSQAIFEWIYGLNNSFLKPYKLYFESVSDKKINSKIINPRVEKEQISLQKLFETKKDITNLKKLHQWLFRKHGAYTLKFFSDKNSAQVLKSY